MKKRGISQIDWAVSLGVFVIFLTLFFILVYPFFNPEPEQFSILGSVIDKFADASEQNTVLWTVNTLPVYFNSSIKSIRAVALEFPYYWGTGNTSFLDKREFWIDESRIFFLHNLSQSEAGIVNSNHSYTQISSAIQLECTASNAETDNLDLDISDSEITRIRYDGDVMAENMDLIVSGSSSFTNKSFICKYSKSGHDFYLMNDSIVFSYFDSSQIELEMDFPDDKFDYYYDGSSHSIPYNDDSCISDIVDIIDFYDDNGIAFVSENFNATFCYENRTGDLKLNASLKFFNPYKIILHDGSYINATRYTSSKIAFGLMQKIEGLSYEKLELLNQSRNANYEKLKEDWGIESVRDFDWRVTGKT
jgi:hypothetical protein